MNHHNSTECRSGASSFKCSIGQVVVVVVVVVEEVQQGQHNIALI